MADNTQLDPGTGGDTIRDKDRAGVKTQIVGLDLNPAGSEVLGTGDATNGLDVDVTRVQGTVTVNGSGVTQPVSAASLPLPSGASTAAKQPALGTAGTASADVVSVQGVASMTALKVDGSAVTQPVSGTVTANAGTGTLAVKLTPQTTGGLSIFRSIDLDETEEDVKTSAGQLFGWYLFNGDTATLYVKIYNATAANVTVGTTTPVLTIPVPAGAGANVLAETGIAFSTAISAACTTGVADNDTGAPAANVLIANFFYA